MKKFEAKAIDGGLGWCLQEEKTGNWWCLSRVLDAGLIVAYREDSVGEPSVFQRIADDCHGHLAKLEAPRFARAVRDYRNQWTVPRQERLVLIMVPARKLQPDSGPLPPSASQEVQAAKKRTIVAVEEDQAHSQQNDQLKRRCRRPEPQEVQWAYMAIVVETY